MNLFIAYLLGLLTATRNQNHSSSEPEQQEERKNCPLNPIVTEIRLPERIEGEWRTGQEKQYSIQKQLVIATWFTFGAVFVYAAITLALWDTSQQQLKILRESRDRPWIKFSEDILESGITFKPESGEQRESIGIEHSFRFENLGKLPARNYAVSVRTFYFDDVYGMERWTRTNWKQPTCNAAQSKLRTVMNGLLIKGECNVSRFGHGKSFGAIPDFR